MLICRPDRTADALAEAMAIFEAVMAGSWRWPDPEDSLDADDQRRLQPEEISKLVSRLEKRLLRETVGASTWRRTDVPYFQKLRQQAASTATTWSNGLRPMACHPALFSIVLRGRC